MIATRTANMMTCLPGIVSGEVSQRATQTIPGEDSPINII
jgi:hypothetical protein